MQTQAEFERQKKQDRRTIEEAARELGMPMPTSGPDLEHFAVQCQTHGVAVNVQDEPFWKDAIAQHWAKRRHQCGPFNRGRCVRCGRVQGAD